MAKKPSITTVSSGYQSTTTINSNTQNLRDAFDNTLSLDGSTPNAMQADFDMNSNDILNVDKLYLSGLYIDGQPVAPGTLNYNGVIKETQTATSGQTVFNLTTMVYNPGINSLSVYVDGVYQNPSTYTENNSTRITFSAGLHVGAIVDFVALSINEITGAADASSVTYTPAGSGAVTTTVANKLKQYVSVKDFGAIGNGTANDTTAIQAAINSGKSLVFPEGTYLANNLTGSQNFQRFYADGRVTITKNANGPLFSHSGIYIELDGLQFNGDSSTPTFTGDNLVLTGSNPRLINCGSQYAYELALKATGDHVQIIGTCGIYQSANSGSLGYDVEIGVSGTATLYHQIYGLYTSQATGGIKLIDTGSHAIIGGQFGKLYIASGTSPAGVNGGSTSNARILGTVTVEMSNSIFTGNQFSTQTITFAAGTSNHYLDTSNLFNSATVVNNGNANAPIIKSVGTGSPSGIILQYGADASNATIRYDGDEIYLQDSSFNLPNNKAIRFANAAGTYVNAATLNSSNNWTFGSNTGATFTNIASGTTGVYLVPDSTSTAYCTTAGFQPVADGTTNLGGASNRWNTVYASTGTINTSDIHSKQDIDVLNDAERRVATALRKSIRKYRFKDAVKEKGSEARIHIGVIAQDVMAIFKSEGLDASQYGILCYDTWEAKDAVLDNDGNVVSPACEAGERYGIRYDELMAFILGAL